MDLAERQLPYSQEAEQSVIGSVLTNIQSVAASAEIIRPDDFFLEHNREIYQVVMDLFNENTPVDIVTVSDRLRRADKLDAVGGIQYLSTVAANVPTTRNIIYYSKIIKEKSVLRKLVGASQVISEMAFSGSDRTERILEQAEQLVFDVASSKESQDIIPVNSILKESYMEMVEHAQNNGSLTGLATGFEELDRRTAGLQNSDLILIAGRPGMGKSSFAVNIAEHVAIDEGVPVAIFNLEMSKSQLVNRILCSQALVESEKVRSGNLSGEDWAQIGEVVDKVAMAPLYIDDTPSITVSEIRAKCRRLKQTKNLGLIVIDYLQLMQSAGRTDNRQQEISEISRSLKILAKELDIPVITLSQLSRASESRSDKRPMLSDLRESGAIEQDADIVMFLYRDEYYNPDSEDKNLAECIIAKYRAGETGTFKLGWQGKYTKFLNVEYGVSEEEA
jgi:replicative DNA helicase